jgi:uncharacterized membrane protein
MWINGTIIYVSGALLLFASFALAPASLLAPLESIQFVTNVIFGRFVLKRTVTPKMIFGTCLIVSGTIIALCSGPHVDPVLTLDQLTAHWHAQSWLIFLAAVASIAAIAWIVHHLCNYQVARGRFFPWPKMVSPLTYALYSAIIGTQSVVEAKCMSSMVAIWLTGKDDIWKNPYTYACVIGWIPLVAVWLYQLNNALSIYDPLFMIPLLQANFILFAVLSGGVFFGEFDNLTASQWIGFMSGVIVMFLGLYFLASASLAMEREHLESMTPTFSLNAGLRTLTSRANTEDGICQDRSTVSEASSAKDHGPGIGIEQVGRVSHPSVEGIEQGEMAPC